MDRRLRLARRRRHQALSGRRCRLQSASGSDPYGSQCHHRRRARGQDQRVLRRCRASDAGQAVHRVRVRADGGTDPIPGRQRVHLSTSSPAAGATSCVRSPGSLYGIPPERVVGSAWSVCVLLAKATPTCTPPRAGGSSTTGPIKPVRLVEPDRAPADIRGGQLQRRLSRCWNSPGAQPVRRCNCWSCTTTPTANSITPPGRRRRWTTPRSRLDRGQHGERLDDRLSD